MIHPRRLRRAIGLLLCGAVCGWIVTQGITGMYETWHHKGPGVVTYGDGDRYPEFEKVEGEQQYKRYHYAQHGMMVFIGLFVAGIVALAYGTIPKQLLKEVDALDEREERIGSD